MSIDKRVSEKQAASNGIGNGPYLAKVVSHLDPSFMNGLEVTILRDQANEIGEDSQTYFVKYMTPFFGSTAYEFMGTNTGNDDAFNDTQKSYGMWFTPPDVGGTVMVMFIDGNPSEGYWIGCIPGRFANNMVPAIGATKDVDISPADKKKYDTSQPLPVAEINRKATDLSKGAAIDKIKRPVHPIADRFLEQGLLEDDVRGATTSTSRRDVPNMVFGISSPGPLDKRSNAKKSYIGRKQSKSSVPVHVSRLGGTTFVMDDGDDRYQRATPAGGEEAGPVKYLDILAGEKGDSNIPYNEYFRIRTRTGHQLLMHNSEDLMYIGNARGTTWIELTSNGKIDIFAEDSISIHTKNDMNFRADRDLNLEAGRNINIKATAEYQDPTKLYEDKAFTDATGYESGRIQIESEQNFNLLIGRNGKIHVRNDEQIQGNLDIKVLGNMRIAVQDKDTKPTNTSVQEKDGKEITLETQPEGLKGLHIYSYENTYLNTIKDFNVNTGGSNAITAGKNTDIKSGGNHTETAAKIDMNGPAAAEATKSEIADKIAKLNLHKNVLTDKDLPWKKRYQTDPIESIMTRIPMHEPWPLHENQAPNLLTPEYTDREA
jgi:hypothetical protein